MESERNLSQTDFYFIARLSDLSRDVISTLAYGQKWLMLATGQAPESDPAISNVSNQTLQKVDSAEELLKLKPALITVSSPALRSSLSSGLVQLLEELDQQQPCFVVLVQNQKAPEFEDRDDGLVSSFACHAEILCRLLAEHPDGSISGLCFDILDEIVNGRTAVRSLIVRQLPSYVKSNVDSYRHQRQAVLMAHRGRLEHLEAALTFMGRARGTDIQPTICLDVDDPESYARLVRLFPNAKFFLTQPAPAGPYFIRQELARMSTEPVLVFHDSDDISCSDRFESMYHEMIRTGCDLLGCHELRINEIERTIKAIRFPIDVSKALGIYGGHALLHPTSIIKRNAFLSTGGFSTNLLIASDSQFLLRAYFNLKIRNADDFYYIRRVHNGALTVKPATALGNPFRNRMDFMWRRDFELVKRRVLTLSQSSLRPLRSPEVFQVMPYCSPHRVREGLNT